jgi:hypothetical protein
MSVLSAGFYISEPPEDYIDHIDPAFRDRRCGSWIAKR